jgi:hypothetical protein
VNNLQKSLLVAGVLGLGSAVAAPAFAGNTQAYASGSSTIVLMNGASQSIGAEIAGPAGPAFANTAVVVTPTLTNAATTALSVNTNTLTTLNVNPGQATLAPSANSSVEAAVASIVGAGATTLEQGVSYTRAWRSGLE